MATYEIKAPDGNTYSVDGPDGASQAQVQAEVLRQNPGAGTVKPGPLGSEVPGIGGYPDEQAKPKSAVEKLLSMASSLGTGAANVIGGATLGTAGQAAGNIAGLGAIPAHALGLTDKDPAQVQSDVSGAFTSGLPPADPTSILSKIGGGLTAGARTVGNAYGSAAGALGAPQGLSDAISNGVTEAGNQIPAFLGTKLPEIGAARVAAADAKAVATAPKVAAIQDAKNSGYILLPSDMPQGAPLAGKIAAGIGGKNDMNSAVSIANQHITNGIAKADIGIPASAPLNGVEIAKRDAVANQGYAAIRDADQNTVPKQVGTSANGKPTYRMARAGPMQVDPQYVSDIQAIGANKATTALGVDPAVMKLQNKLLGAQGAVLPNDAMTDLNTLRTQARSNLKATDNPTQLELGQAQMQAADAMENRISRYLQTTNQPDLYKQFTDARTLKAKLNTVKDNVNNSTYDVDAQGIAKERENTGGAKSPMSGGLLKIANAADALPNTVKNTDKVQMPAPFSALGATAVAAGSAPAFSHSVGAGAATGATGAAILAARPAARASLMSDLYQRTLNAQSPTASALSRLAASPASPLAGAALVPNNSPQ